MDKDNWSKYLKFQIRIGKRKVKSETFEYLATEYGSLKMFTLIFMIEIPTERRKERITLSHDSKFRNRDNHISWEIQVWSWKIFELNQFDIQSQNVEASKSSSSSYIVIWPYDRQGNDGRRQDTKYRVLVAEYETDGSMKFITGEDLFLVSWQNQKNSTSEVEFDEALPRSI